MPPEETIFAVFCSICGEEFTTVSMADCYCPKCHATIYDKDPRYDKWRCVPAIRVTGVA